MNPEKERELLYPEIAAKGSLCAALAEALADMGSKLIPTENEKFFRSTYARAEAGSRFSQVYIAAEERLFLVDFWSNGVHLADGKTPDLKYLALAIHRWMADGKCLVAELTAAFDWTEVKTCAEAFEEGWEVTWKWQRMLEDEEREERAPGFLELVKGAAAEPRLRMLFPFTSLMTLCFSRCTGYPFDTRDTPCITPLGDGTFQVSGLDGKAIGTGSAAVAVRLATEHLPLGCGAARPGPAEDLS